MVLGVFIYHFEEYLDVDMKRTCLLIAITLKARCSQNLKVKSLSVSRNVKAQVHWSNN